MTLGWLVAVPQPSLLPDERQRGIKPHAVALPTLDLAAKIGRPANSKAKGPNPFDRTNLAATGLGEL